jgi:Fanconi anemia group J protein
MVVEGRKAESFADTIAEYYSAVHVGNGALLLAVCRGKVSEGLDFKGERARAVFVVGIPFPNFGDNKVKLKQEFNDRYCKPQPSAPKGGGGPEVGRVITGGAWYKQQGFRAYNQAIGRCIRNLQDFGASTPLESR